MRYSRLILTTILLLYRLCPTQTPKRIFLLLPLKPLYFNVVLKMALQMCVCYHLQSYDFSLLNLTLSSIESLSSVVLTGLVKQ